MEQREYHIKLGTFGCALIVFFTVIGFMTTVSAIFDVLK